MKLIVDVTKPETWYCLLCYRLHTSHSTLQTPESTSSITTPQVVDKRHVGGSQHYTGPPARESSLAGAVDEPSQTPSNSAVQKQNQYSNCPPQLCLYNRGGNECRESITCHTVPGHFSSVHGINGGRSIGIVCEWQGCGIEVGRHNFMRHIRTTHMGHPR
ncbi:hypothetical protein EDC04DRAFT_2823259 [Pisolithus marmoratus]|nr:hypothetical protein EDC04DRAFT_2823259 [Pisolithus marmoratus]